MRAFTLVEAVVSVSVISIIMLATGSAVVLAMRALPDPQRPAYRVNQSSQVTDQIVAELQESRHIVERTSSAVTFTVADRNGDGAPEQIRYAWSETAGEPLTRQYNQGSVVNVLEDVHEFCLGLDIQAVTEEYPGPPVESAESIFSQYTATGDCNYVVNSPDWVGQYFHPDEFLPAEALAWTITKVGFVARTAGLPSGQIYVQLRPATGENKPGTEVLESNAMNEDSLSDTYEWIELPFSSAAASNLSVDQGVCLVLEWKKKDDAADIHCVQSQGSGRVETSDGGASWTHHESSSMRYKIWGTYTVPGPNQTATRQYITGIRLTLQAGTDAETRIDTAVHVPNVPEVLSTVWELDFDTDPRALDINADGVNDWDQYSGTFDPSTLSNGIWYAPDHGTEGICIAPGENFAELTTVDLRYRAMSVGGFGAVFWINADRHSGTSANLVANLCKPDTSSQELWFGWELESGDEEWVGIYDVPDALVNVRLVIDPVADTVGVFVNGTHKGTYTYFRGNSNPDALAWVYTNGCSGEFDYVSIRVGGNSP